MALLVTACATNRPAPGYSVTYHPNPENERAREQRSRVLLDAVVECRINAAAAMARSKRDVAPAEAANAAINMCKAERENWIANEVSPGVSYALASSVMDSTERCAFPLLVGYIRLIRSGASQQQIREWAYSRPPSTNC